METWNARNLFTDPTYKLFSQQEIIRMETTTSRAKALVVDKSLFSQQEIIRMETMGPESPANAANILFSQQEIIRMETFRLFFFSTVIFSLRLFSQQEIIRMETLSSPFNAGWVDKRPTFLLVGNNQNGNTSVALPAIFTSSFSLSRK